MSEEPSSVKRLNQLAELISKGSSFAAAVEKLAPVPETETVLLRRASFVRAFDRDMFDAVLAIRGASFDDLIRFPGIERYGPAEGTYRVRDSVAAEHLQGWVGKSPKEIRDFAAAVYKYVAARPGYDEIESLRFRIPVQPAEALVDFERLFSTADTKFDLARCHALVQMLRELDNFQVGRWSAPLRLLSPELRSLCDDAIPYVTARGRFIEEFAKSANYLERDEVKARIETLLRPSGDWLLPIFGSGGSGKTIFLQWLIARYCVPRPQRIPVAMVDFDDINIAKLGRYPHLLLLRLAEQLDRQVFGSPFSDLLQRYGKFASILLPSARIPRGQSVDGLESELQSSSSLESELLETFAMNLSGRLVLSILDTVEEGMLHFPDALGAAITILRGIQQQSRYFKVLLSGRYNLADRGFLKDTDPPALEIKPFTADEAARYLRESRQVETHDLVPAIIAKARGNPFILALIADLVIKGDVRSVACVEELQPEFAYLIRRIIGRIPDSQYGVRWVIRYGVIPRRLTLDFLQHVMEPELRQELAVAGGHLDKLKEYEPSFPRGGPIEVGALWSELRQYAAPNGWLRATPEDLRFQPEVVKPMRALLVQEEVHDVLHQRARDWFESQADAENDPGRWADWMAEALYHRFWLLSGEAVERWRTCLGDRRAASGSARRTLLEVVTGFAESEQDDATPVIEPRVQGALSTATVGWALLEWAKSGAGIGFGPCTIEESPSNIRRALGLARTFYPEDEWPAAVENLIEMALAVDQRTYQRAAGLGQAFSTERRAAEEVYAYSILMARALAGLGDDGAEARYAAAFDLFQRSGSETYPGFEILAECARALAKLGRPDRALANYRRALESAGTGAEPLALEAAELHLQTGACAEALRLVRDGQPTPKRVRIQVLAYVAQGRLRLATDAWHTALPHDSASAEECETRGVLSSAWYQLDTAPGDLEQALTLYRRAGDAQRTESTLLTLVRLLKDQSGHWRRAQRLLESTSTDSPLLALERAHLQALQEREPDVGPGSAAAGLFLALEKNEAPRPALRRFAEDLKEVLPASARYERLHVFRFAAPIHGVADLDQLFFDAVPVPNTDSPDFFAWVFDYIEMLRCLESPMAMVLLRNAAERQTDNDFVLHRIIQAAAKLGTGLPSTEQVAAFYEATNRDALGVATVIEYASALMDRGDSSAAERFAGMAIPSSLQGTVAEARHLLNRARLLADNDPDRFALLTAAVAILRVLGQEAPARGLVAQMEPRARRARPAPQVARSAADDKHVVITLGTLTDPWDAPPERRVVSFEHVKALSRPESEVVGKFRSALPYELVLHDLVGLEPVIELAVDDAPLVALPWEWAFSADAVCYRSSRFLSPIDAKTSPLRFVRWKTPGLMRRLLSFFYPVRVIILKQPIAYQERAQRGFETVSRRPLAAIYRAHGVGSFAPDRLESGAIAEAFAVQRPQLVHIQAPVLDDEGTLVLDLPLFTRGQSTPQRFTADHLNQFFRSLPRTSDSPLLILDPPRPQDDAEVVRQLLLRNRFAADFVALGNARAVLCTGLFDVSRLERAAERLARWIRLNPRLQELLMLCKKEGTDRFSGQGTALFAADPAELLR